MALLFLATIPIAGCSLDFLKQKISAYTDAPLMQVAQENLSELDQATFAFADRFVTLISDATDRAAQENSSQLAKTEALRIKLHNASSMYAIASSASPLGKLLDMVTVVTLNKVSLVDEGRSAKLFGPSHVYIDKAILACYDDIWKIVANYLQPPEVESVKKVIVAWRKQYPEVTTLAYVRFGDFARARAGLQQKLPAIGSLFDKINQVNKTVETAQQFGERTLFYMQRMPRLLQWQTERTVEGVFDTTDMQKIQQSVGKFSDAATIFAREIQKLEQREAAIQKHLEQVTIIVETFRKALPEARATIQDGQKLMVTATQTSDSLNDTLQVADKITTQLTADDGKKDPNQKPFDINDYKQTVEELSKVMNQANQLVGAVQTNGLGEHQNELQKLVEGQIDHLSLRIAQLALLIFGLFLIYRFLSSRVIKTPAEKGAV